MLIIPPSLEEQEDANSILLDWIVFQHRNGAVISSVCAGIFILAQTGLINKRSVTTHWSLKEKVSQQFSEINLETDKMIHDDGDIVTAGGVMSWTDLGLKFIDRFMGSSTMLEIARFFLIDPNGREQQFYSTFTFNFHHGDSEIIKTQHWLQRNYNLSISNEDMAAIAKLSNRTFLRRFKAATGFTPTAYLQILRAGKARELLELFCALF